MTEMSDLLAVNNKLFSTLFSVKGPGSNEKYKAALVALGLSHYLQSFVSVEDNYTKLLAIQEANWRTRRKTIKGKPGDSVTLNVPGRGDCWLIAILAPLLGFVVDGSDSCGILSRVRSRLCKAVETDVKKYENIFLGEKDRDRWCKQVVTSREWDGDDAFEVFSRLTEICIHTISLDHTREASIERVRHYLPRKHGAVSTSADWETSVVVQFGGGHYKVVIPTKLPFQLTVTDKVVKYGHVIDELDITSECDEQSQSEVTAVKRKMPRFPRRPSQKARMGKTSQLKRQQDNSSDDPDSDNSEIKDPVLVPSLAVSSRSPR